MSKFIITALILVAIAVVFVACRKASSSLQVGGIYSTKDGSSIDNQYVTVTGTAYDVAYMDAITDTDNTVY